MSRTHRVCEPSGSRVGPQDQLQRSPRSRRDARPTEARRAALARLPAELRANRIPAHTTRSKTRSLEKLQRGKVSGTSAQRVIPPQPTMRPPAPQPFSTGTDASIPATASKILRKPQTKFPAVSSETPSPDTVRCQRKSRSARFQWHEVTAEFRPAPPASQSASRVRKCPAPPVGRRENCKSFPPLWPPAARRDISPEKKLGSLPQH